MQSKLSLNLPAHLRGWVEAQATAQGFATPGEYVRHLLAEQRRSAVREAIDRRLLHALDTNEYFKLTDKHFQQLDEKLVALAKPSRRRHAAKR
jgi:hypothetical protein